MKTKTSFHDSSLPDVNSTTKVFWVSQKTQAQRALISAASTSKSLIIIGVYKGTATPIVEVPNSIVVS